MIKLSVVKEELGIATTDTSLDSMLTRVIRQVAELVREKTNRYIIGIGTVSGNSTTLTVTSVGHGLIVGGKVQLRDDAGIVTGKYVVVTTGRDTFTVASALVSPATVTNLDVSIHPYRSTWAHGSGIADLYLPTVLTPIDALMVVRINDEDVAVEPVEYQAADPKIARLRKTDGTNWLMEYRRIGSSQQFSVMRKSSEKSVFLEGYVGLKYLPATLEMAILSMICDLAEREGTGKDVASDTFEGVGRSRLTGTDRTTVMISPDRVLLMWKGS